MRRDRRRDVERRLGFVEQHGHVIRVRGHNPEVEPTIAIQIGGPWRARARSRCERSASRKLRGAEAAMDAHAVGCSYHRSSLPSVSRSTNRAEKGSPSVGTAGPAVVSRPRGGATQHRQCRPVVLENRFAASPPSLSLRLPVRLSGSVRSVLQAAQVEPGTGVLAVPFHESNGSIPTDSGDEGR